MKFLLLIHDNPEAREALEALSEEQRRELIGGPDGLAAKTRALRESGELVSVLVLDDPATGDTVQLIAGTPVISDRPFLETKEFLAGAILVECPTVERALEIAADVPAASMRRIEIRPVRVLDDEEFAVPGLTE